MGRNIVRAGISAGLIVLAGAYVTTIGGLPALSGVSASHILLIALALTVTIFLGALRLQLAASDLGHRLQYRDCLAAAAAGNAAGYVVFQVIGQIAARSAVLGRLGVSVDTTALATMYERLVALFVSAAMATAGGVYVFGKVGVDLNAGGQDLIKITVSMALVTMTVAIIVWRDLIARHIAPLLTAATLRRIARLAAVTLLIQGATLSAFVLAARQFYSPASTADLIAASAIVMFAAAIPISFAGWGVRELGAVAALGAVGVSAGAALSAAVLIGLLSFVTVCLVAVLSLSFTVRASAPRAAAPDGVLTDWRVASAWVLPLAAALFVFFQIRVPITGGFTNLSPADLFAAVAGISLVFNVAADPVLRAKLWPVLWFCMAGSALFLLSYFIGAASFGATQWATSKLIGWFVLLAYAATGVSVALYAGREGIERVALTMIVACCAIIVIDVGAHLGVGRGIRHEGFAGNANAFAFQISICFAVGLATLGRMKLWPVMAAILIMGLLLTISRSGMIAFGVVAAVAIIFRPEQRWRMIGALVGGGMLAGLSLIGLSGSIETVSHQAPLWLSDMRSSTEMAPSDNERWRTMTEALAIFVQNPIFGAGLGYYYGQLSRAGGGALVIHSTPLWILAEFGLIGAAVFATFAVRSFWMGARSAWRGDDVALLLVLVGCVFCVMGAAQDMFYQRTFWLTAGLSIAVLLRRRGSKERQ